jgi:hypothetical protein
MSAMLFVEYFEPTKLPCCNLIDTILPVFFFPILPFHECIYYGHTLNFDPNFLLKHHS